MKCLVEVAHAALVGAAGQLFEGQGLALLRGGRGAGIPFHFVGCDQPAPADQLAVAVPVVVEEDDVDVDPVLRGEELDDPLGLRIELGSDDDQPLFLVQGIREVGVKGLPIERLQGLLPVGGREALDLRGGETVNPGGVVEHLGNHVARRAPRLSSKRTRFPCRSRARMSMAWPYAVGSGCRGAGDPRPRASGPGRSSAPAEPPGPVSRKGAERGGRPRYSRAASEWTCGVSFFAS
jgi:hypothetical protein